MQHFATKAVDAIVLDLSDRGGFDGVWDQLGHDVRDEIKKTWVAEVLKAAGERERALLELISRLVPFAESRAEHISELDDSSDEARKAWGAVEDAKCALAEVMPQLVIGDAAQIELARPAMCRHEELPPSEQIKRAKRRTRSTASIGGQATEGPFRVERCGGDWVIRAASLLDDGDPDGIEVAVVHATFPGKTHPADRADALLFAAVPAYALAWSLVLEERREEILAALPTWVRESIDKAEDP